jgi:hypothetical protein
VDEPGLERPARPAHPLRIRPEIDEDPFGHQGFAHSGVPEKLIVPVGLIELTCLVVYLIPRTAALGAILMTGLLGGATITGLRIADPTYPMPVILGMMAWGGLYLRDVRLRELIPLRKESSEG